MANERRALEKLQRRPRLLVAMLMASTALGVAVGCGENENSSNTYVQQAAKRLADEFTCYSRNNPYEDCDNDGVTNSLDAVAGRADFGDDDGDGVLNLKDKWSGIDDKTVDSDGDSIPDYQDTFLGDNYGDIDHDGWANEIDPQPYSAPPSTQPPVTPPSTVSREQLINELLLDQIRRKYSAELFGPSPDTDIDGIPDDADSTPTEFTNDRDGDGDPDYYDPKPSDPYTDSKNDPYDPTNDEYWNDNGY